MEREYEGDLAALCEREGLSCVPYFALAMGFLTGKYRSGGDAVDSPRAGGASKYLENGGPAVLGALDEIAGAHATTVAAVALAWLAAQPTVAAPSRARARPSSSRICSPSPGSASPARSCSA